MTLKIDPYADAQEQVIPSDSKLTEIKNLAFDLLALKIKIAENEAGLKSLKEQTRILEEETLPDAMSSVHMKTFTLQNGYTFAIEPFLHCSLAGKAKTHAIAWLRATKQDGLIKRVVSVAFGKGGEAAAQSLAEQLAQRFSGKVENKEDVNTTSFKALVNELIAEGKPVPLQDLGVYAGRHAVITSPTKESTDGQD